MFKRIFVGTLAAAILVGGITAPVASALTVDEVYAQIQSLLLQVEALKKQLTSLQGSSQNTNSGQAQWQNPGTKHRVCALMNRSLTQGARGDDVQSLQEFLMEQGLFMGTATGYFGPVTASALAQWQAREGVSPVGIFGPRSLERMRLWCGNKAPVSEQRFQATPEQGAAPLTVTFSSWISGFRPNNIEYVIEYGDGTSEAATPCNAPADACVSPGLNKHTYTQNGTYTAQLKRIEKNTCTSTGDTVCAAWFSKEEVIGTATISVGAPVACTKEYAPVCGAKPIVCITTPCNPIPTTYGNSCMMKAEGASLLYEGQCRDEASPESNPQCKSWFDGCNTCSRSTPGGPGMCTLKACIDQAAQKPYCTAYFSSTNSAPTISSFSGPTSLTVNESGTWTIQAQDPENEQLTYSVTWGDEQWYASLASVLSGSKAFTQTTSFSHAYTAAGTYTVKIVVRDASGNEAKTTSTVQVKGAGPVACTMEYAPVCGQPPFSCPSGMYCAQAMPAPQTYGNACSMKAAGATLLYQGECSSGSSSSIIPWQTALGYISRCEVSGVMQAHSLAVQINLKNGARYSTTEPHIDAVIQAVQSSGCSGVIIATE